MDTISSFEGGQTNPYARSLEKIVNELERRGIEFIDGKSPPSTGEAIGVRLNLEKAAEFARSVKETGQARNESER